MAELTGERGASSVAVAAGGRLRAGTMTWPVPGRVEARFGRQPSSRFGTMVNRNGIDIGADPGSPVKAVQAGTVAYADAFAGFGRVVIVDHGGRFYTLYGHLASVDVSKGAAVQAGDEIGTVGMAPDRHALALFRGPHRRSAGRSRRMAEACLVQATRVKPPPPRGTT